MSDTVKNPTASPISIRFSKVSIRPDGEIGCITISQGDEEIVLTLEQARSLVTAIEVKLGR